MAFRVQAPVYEQRVAPSVRPGYRQNRGDLVSRAQQGLAQSVGQVGEVGEQLVKMGAQMREEQQRAALLSARTELQRDTEGLLNDPDNGLMSARGDQARIRRNDFTSAYAADVDRIKKTIDPSLAEKFDAFVAEDGIRFQQSVDVHVAREQERFAAEALESHLDAIPSLAVGAAQRGEQDQAPGIIASGLGTIDAEASRPGGALAGKPKEVVDALRLGFTTKAHVGVLGELLRRGRLDEAKGYFEVSRGQIDPLQIAKIEERLNAGDRVGKARVLADRIYDVGEGRADVMQGSIESIEDPEIRDHVQRFIDHRVSVEDRAEHQRWEPVVDSVLTDLAMDLPVTMDDDRIITAPSWARKAIAYAVRAKDAHDDPTQAERSRSLRNAADWARSQVEMLPLNEQAALDVYNTDRWKHPKSGVSPDVSVLSKARADATRRYEKVGDISVRSFEAALDKAVRDAEIDPNSKRGKAIKGDARAKFFNWIDREAAETGAVPDTKDVKEWTDTAIVRTVTMFGLGSQVSVRPPPETPRPAAEAALTLIGPNGERRTAIKTPELGKWLSDHPKWKIEGVGK